MRHMLRAAVQRKPRFLEGGFPEQAAHRNSLGFVVLFVFFSLITKKGKDSRICTRSKHTPPGRHKTFSPRPSHPLEAEGEAAWRELSIPPPGAQGQMSPWSPGNRSEDPEGVPPGPGTCRPRRPCPPPNPGPRRFPNFPWPPPP